MWQPLAEAFVKTFKCDYVYLVSGLAGATTDTNILNSGSVSGLAGIRLFNAWLQ